MAEILNLGSIMEARGRLGKEVALDETDSESFVSQMQKEGEERALEIKKTSTEKSVPIADKALLTLEEAAKYTGIGQNKLREISNEDDCPFVLWNGSKRMFKREKLVSFLYSTFSI